MSSTGSPSRTAPATDGRTALIVAHGFPSSPDGPEAHIRRLADRVAGHLPAWRVRGATLAAPGTLETALKAALDEDRGAPPLVYPMFMSDGWFVQTALPERLRRITPDAVTITRAFGLDIAVRGLCLDAAMRGAAAHGLRCSATTLVLAAHGSPTHAEPRDAAESVAAHLRAHGAFRSVRTGFIDQAPRLAEAARTDTPALCLPFFAMRAGHVETDLPHALEAAAFRGAVLDPIGMHRGVVAIIAGALAAGAAHRMAAPG